jgi:hypothetical protein
MTGICWSSAFWMSRRLVSSVLSPEGERGATASGAGGAPDPVDVALRLVREFVVDYLIDIVDVDAPTRDVGGNKDVNLPAVKVPQRPLPGVLTLVAVEVVSGDAVFPQMIGDVLRLVLRPGKDEGAKAPLLGEEHTESVPFWSRVTKSMCCAISGVDPASLSTLTRTGLFSISSESRLTSVGSVAGEEEGLSLRGERRNDAPYIRDEAHIEHPVRLVEDNRLDPGRVR